MLGITASTSISYTYKDSVSCGKFCYYQFKIHQSDVLHMSYTFTLLIVNMEDQGEARALAWVIS